MVILEKSTEMDVLYQLCSVPSLKLFTDSKISTTTTTTQLREPRIEWNPKLEYMQKWKEWSMDRTEIETPPSTINQVSNESTTDTTELLKEIKKTTTTIIDQEEKICYNTNYSIVHNSNDSNNQRQDNMDMNNHVESPVQPTTTSPLISVTSLTSPQLLPLSLNDSQESIIVQEEQLQGISQQRQRKEDNRIDSHPKQDTKNTPLERAIIPSIEPLSSAPKYPPDINHEIIFTRATSYQHEQCQRAIATATPNTSNTILRNEFEKLLNILNHPDSEIIEDNVAEFSTDDNDRIKRSGKTFLLFELLGRITSLKEKNDIAIVTENHNTETVIYNILRSNGYLCERIPVILENNWTKEHGVFITTDKKNSFRKWSNRPMIDIMIILDIRILPTNTIFSKLDGQRRALWIITKSTVEERAFDILRQSMVNNNHWMDIWESNENLRNTMYKADLGIGLSDTEEMVRKSITRAMSFLFRSASLWSLKRNHSSDTTNSTLSLQQHYFTKRTRLNIPASLPSSLSLSTSSSPTLQDTTTLSKQKGTICSPYIIGDDDDDDKSGEPPTPVPEKAVKTINNYNNENITIKDVENSTIDFNQFGKRIVNTIDQLLEYPQTLNIKRKYKEISKATTLSREFKGTLNKAENTLYTQAIQSRLETIESSFHNEYQQYMEYLQSKYLDDMAALQKKYKEEALNALDTAIINHPSYNKT